MTGQSSPAATSEGTVFPLVPQLSTHAVNIHVAELHQVADVLKDLLKTLWVVVLFRRARGGPSSTLTSIITEVFSEKSRVEELHLQVENLLTSIACVHVDTTQSRSNSGPSRAYVDGKAGLAFI